MSVHSRRLVLLPEARGDLRHILLFTEQRWGKVQRQNYRGRLFAVFDELARFPNLGRLRPEFGADTLSFRVGQHVVLYRFTDFQLIISRVLHVRRDAEGEVSVVID